MRQLIIVIRERERKKNGWNEQQQKKKEAFVYANINLKNIICWKDFFLFYLLVCLLFRFIYTFQYNCSCMKRTTGRNEKEKQFDVISFFYYCTTITECVRQFNNKKREHDEKQSAAKAAAVRCRVTAKKIIFIRCIFPLFSRAVWKSV